MGDSDDEVVDFVVSSENKAGDGFFRAIGIKNWSKFWPVANYITIFKKIYVTM